VSGSILILNAGSSSIKFALFPADTRPTRKGRLCDGEMEGIGQRIHFFAKDGAGNTLAERQLDQGTNHEAAMTVLLEWVETRSADGGIVAVGHRVVHGGTRYAAPVRIDVGVIAELERLVPLAPLHQPHHLAAIAAVAKLHPDLPQIACFDTAFHHGQPAVASAFALPRGLAAEGVRRYGFHGLSYEYIASVLPEYLEADGADGRVVVAHLGSGASMCALRGHKSVATTMGFTALDGLMMGRRCGALDPGVILYLLQQKSMTAEAVSELLYQDSGLYGVSGISDDMRTLLASPDPRAAEAIELFVYRIGRELGSLAAALGGVDALVFTAGIGERAAEVRRRVCADSAWLGIELDETANSRGGPCISRAGCPASAWVIPTDEDLMIARHSWRLLGDMGQAAP
jgi:acetate kinase